MDYNKLINYCKDYRTRSEALWFINKMFLEHNKYYRLAGNTLKEYHPSGIKRNINLIRPLLRGVRTLVTKNEPRWHIKETNEIGHEDEETYIATLLLRNIYRGEKLKDKIKDLIYNSSIAGNGYWQVYYDPFKDNQGDVAIENISPFDILLDPIGKIKGSYFDGRWIIKKIEKPIKEIHNDKRYSKDRINIQPEVDTDSYKSAIETVDGNRQTSDTELSTAIIYEIYEKTDNGINLTTFSQGYILRQETLPYSTFPIFVYQMERMGGKIYPQPWITPLIEIVKANNRIASMIEEWIYTTVKGKWGVREGENFKSTLTNNGEILRYKNVIPHYIQPGTIGNTPFSYTAMIQSRIEDIGGLHSVSAGKLDNSLRTGIGIAQLQASDLNNISEAVDNLKTFLQDVAEFILELASKEYTTIKKLYYVKDDITVIGSASDKQYSDTIKKVKPFKGIEVEIVPGSAFSDLQARQDILSLLQAGVQIPQDVILETFAIGDTAEIVRKIEMEQEKNKDPDIDIANAENKKLLMGAPVVANQTDNHQIHLAIHGQLLDGVKDNPEIAQFIVQHMKQHEALIQGGAGEEAQLEELLQTQQQPEQPQQQPEQSQQQGEEKTLNELLK